MPNLRKREKMVKSIKSRVTEQLQNFANETSIHGICFVAQPAQPRLKRAIWFVLVSISLMYAGIQITNVLKGKFYFWPQVQTVINKTEEPSVQAAALDYKC